MDQVIQSILKLKNTEDGSKNIFSRALAFGKHCVIYSDRTKGAKNVFENEQSLNL